MLVRCDKCAQVYDDAKRWTLCPHPGIDYPPPRKYEIVEHAARPTPDLAQFHGYSVGQWCPSPDGTGRPEAVVISIELGPGCTLNERLCSAVGLRLGSRHAINTLIEVLERHRDEVFPKGVTDGCVGG